MPSGGRGLQHVKERRDPADVWRALTDKQHTRHSLNHLFLGALITWIPTSDLYPTCRVLTRRPTCRSRPLRLGKTSPQTIRVLQDEYRRTRFETSRAVQSTIDVGARTHGGQAVEPPVSTGDRRHHRAESGSPVGCSGTR